MKRALVGLALICLAAGAAGAQSPRADGRVFEREDYLSYFTPGRFASKSVYYSSHGVMEVISNRTRSLFGRSFLTQSMETLDVSPNYDANSGYPFYKIRSMSDEDLAWDEGRKVWVFEYSNADFDRDQSRVWESDDNAAEITAGDKASGDLHRFYNAADARAGRNPEQTEQAFRESVVGLWSWRCVYLRRETFDVECRATHLATWRDEDYSYRRIDLFS